MRQHEANIRVFNLGHFEQMVIEVALTEMAENSGLEQFRNTADELRRLFQIHGTVQVIRAEAES